MKKISKSVVIAENTINEILRHKILNIAFIYVIANFIVLLWITELAPGAESRVIIDIGFASLEILSFLTVLLGTSLLTYEENEFRTIWLILVKPVKRSDFLIGKFIGVISVSTLNTILMVAFLLLSCFIGGVLIDWNFLAVIYMILLEMVLLTSVCIFFSEISTTLTTSLSFTFFIFILGHVSNNLKTLAANTENLVFTIIAYIFYYLIPNLEYFNLKDKLYVSTGPITFLFLLKVTVYSIIYSSISLFISNLIFNKKEFK